ncbi:hypothetical protein GCM10023333_23130 [Ferrimonas pelagia]|uniref:Transposase IS4-like domain-containing protein n=1 Tax=Ferrimonas pelagia TaxID=1177826 RepID=A0ABP9EX64_9GAMM
MIQVDWSDLDGNKHLFLLKAALSFDGRAITLYEEVHGKETRERPVTHAAFLNQLADLLPPDCKPIIVSDAGFRGSWFKQVSALKWHYVGRVRGQSTLSEDGENWFHWKKLAPLNNCSEM